MKKFILAVIIFLTLSFSTVFAINYKEVNRETIINKNEQVLLDSPLFTKVENNEEYIQDEIDLEADGFKRATSNGDLELYYHPKSLALRIKNKHNGFIWATDLVNPKKYGINASQTRFAQTAFEVEYVDEKGKASASSKTAFDSTSSVSVSGKTITFTINISKISLKFKYKVTLTNNGINLKLDHESISEGEKYFLTDIKFFPYFGASRLKEKPGYMFIPSGNGALIRFDQSVAISNSYKERYYGVDANYTQNEERDSLSLPIFGIVHGVNQHAFLAEIEEGSEIAYLNFDPSSIKLGFNRLYNSFTYRQTYMISIPGTDTNVTMIPEDIYNRNISINYNFLEDSDANYVGMAKTYQKKLVKDNIISKNINSGSNKVNIDVLGGETKSGIIMDKFLKMTTTDNLIEINNDLKSELSNDILYTLRGFNKGGLSRHNFNNYEFTSKLGNLKDLNELEYYMYYNPVETYNSKNKANKETLVNIFNVQFVVIVEDGRKYKFYNGHKYVDEGLNKALNKYDNLYLDGITSKLYGDGKLELSRSDVYDRISTKFEKQMPMIRPNLYLLKNTSNYLNMPLYHSRLRFITDSVPFTQILLRGYIDYYSTYLNFSTNQEIDLLRAIEFGSNLSYLISYEESYELASTLSNHLYATHYASNRDLIINQVKTATSALSTVKGQAIIDREQLSVGVVCVTYENNVKVYVNYNNNDYTYNNIVIPKLGYKVVK